MQLTRGHSHTGGGGGGGMGAGAGSGSATRASTGIGGQVDGGGAGLPHFAAHLTSAL